SGVVWSNNFTTLSDGCGMTGSATVTFTATDECGNSVNTLATFTIEDTTAPVIVTPAGNITVECDGSGNTADYQAWLASNGGAAATDSCGTVTWSYAIEDTNTLCGLTGYVIVNFTATDECGNSSTTQATFIIEDTTAPTIGTPASDVTVECDGAGNTTDLMGWLNNNGGALATDLCGDVTWSNNYSGLSNDCGLTGSATVTFTATDSCGNASTTTATFTIEDTTDPVLITPAQNLTVECDGAGNSVQLNAWLATAGGAIASDTCGSIVWTNNFTTLSDGCGMTGSATVTFTATDECGLGSIITTATFTIEDTTSPVVTIPAQDMTVECDGLGNGAELAAWLASNG